MRMGLREFKDMRDFIYAKTGIFIGDNKVYFLKKRVASRIEELGLNSVDDYIKYLKFFDKRRTELQNLINSITVNETYFFREFPQLQAFAEYSLPEVAEQKSDKRIKVLSAGCSTGEEPYTLSIILNEMLDRDYTFKVIGVDVDENVLNKAKEGIYGPRSVKDVPKPYLKKYFTIIGEKYIVKPVVKEKVEFRKINLMDRNRLIALGRDFDFIFCRNVLIYFSDESRRKVVDTFYNMMNPGGYIFLGHSESMSRITSAFKVKKAGNYIVYQKPME